MAGLGASLAGMELTEWDRPVRSQDFCYGCGERSGSVDLGWKEPHGGAECPRHPQPWAPRHAVTSPLFGLVWDLTDDRRASGWPRSVPASQAAVWAAVARVALSELVWTGAAAVQDETVPARLMDDVLSSAGLPLPAEHYVRARLRDVLGGKPVEAVPGD
jgi:hypothetical protein